MKKRLESNLNDWSKMVATHHSHTYKAWVFMESERGGLKEEVLFIQWHWKNRSQAALSNMVSIGHMWLHNLK